MLGDTAVAVHPEDERYKHLIGKEVFLPLTKRKIRIIGDDYVDRTFGSGVVKITPAHDFNDYEMGLRHKLEFLNILNRDGTLNDSGGVYKGLKAQEARKRVLQDLKNQELLIKEEPHTHSVGHCSRSGAVAEPLLSEQWFVRMESLAKPARAVVENGTITFEPELWTKTYLHWMNNIKDWCVSRQLWWGHRIPAWYCKDCGHISVSDNDITQCESCKSSQVQQDEDVLDTWFSSALWPFSTQGWPNKTEALKTFYPTDVLVTGHDIIFFWVARMIMMGLEFCGDVPFRKVVITGLVRNEEGQKMSKSLGNAIDPVDLIEEHGADSVRFTLAAMVSSGRDLKFSMQRLEGYRNFMNKIWNATRFALSALENSAVAEGVINKNDLSDADRWIIYKTGQCAEKVNTALNDLRFSDAANAIYEFAWHELCDWYVEFVKPVIYGTDEKAKATSLRVLMETLNRLMRLLHPFCPFITEEIYQKLPIKNEALIIDAYPSSRTDKEWLTLGDETSAIEMDLVCAVIGAVRNIRGENRIKPGEKLKVRFNPHEDMSQKALGANKALIANIARLEKLDICQEGSLSKCALTPIRLGKFSVDVVVYLEGVVDLDEERKRLQKQIEKLQKDGQSLRARLTNDNFVKNAPAEVVDQGKLQLAEIADKIKALEDGLVRLN
jgi:valyl-tRNA synthetase